MFKRLYTVYDDVSQTTIGGIVMEMNDAPAIRAFHDALKMKDSLLAQHPADYRLLLIGELDFVAGTLVPTMGGSITVATGSAWLESQTNA